MKNIVINESSYSLFKQMIPRIHIQNNVIFIGSVEKEEALGIIGLETQKDELSIVLFAVKKEHRNKKVGSSLLDEAVKYAQKKEKRLTISYDSMSEYSNRLDYMLSKRFFSLETEKVPYFDFALEELQNSPLITQYAIKYKGNPNIVPLNALSVTELKKMEKQYEEKGVYLISRANLLEADSQRSMVLLVNHEVKGLVLIYPTQEHTRLRLEVLYIDKAMMAAGIEMLIEAATRLLREPKGITQIQFTCVDESAYLLTQKLLGKQECQWKYFTYGQLER